MPLPADLRAAKTARHSIQTADDVPAADYAAEGVDGVEDAVSRLLELMAHPDDANLLGPLVVDEIAIRLLRTSIAKRVAQIGRPKSELHRVAEAASWIRSHFDQPVTVDGDGRLRLHERVVIPSTLQGGNLDEPVAVPKGSPIA